MAALVVGLEFFERGLSPEAEGIYLRSLKWFTHNPPHAYETTVNRLEFETGVRPSLKMIRELLNIGLFTHSEESGWFHVVIDPAIEMRFDISRRPKITKYERDRVIKRDGRLCSKCGSTEKLSVDHVIPVTRGGTNDLGNLVILCKPCNSRKGNRLAVEEVA